MKIPHFIFTYSILLINPIWSSFEYPYPIGPISFDRTKKLNAFLKSIHLLKVAGVDVVVKSDQEAVPMEKVITNIEKEVKQIQNFLEENEPFYCKKWLRASVEIGSWVVLFAGLTMARFAWREAFCIPAGIFGMGITISEQMSHWWSKYSDHYWRLRKLETRILNVKDALLKE